jgi:hypothetical protein
MKFLLSILLLGASLPVLAANEGRITSMAFAGERMWSHPDVVQIQIEGGFDFGNCNKTLAAIRKSDEHLVSAATAAYVADKPIKVWIDQGDIYYVNDNRCVINYVIF